MAKLLLPIVGAGIGAAIGGTFLGMSAAGIGWSAGSMASSFLFKPDLPDVDLGPPIGDVRVTVSTQEAAIPIPFGKMRFGGNVIWAEDIVWHEVRTTVEVGGKGGGQEQVQITRYATVSFALGVCEGPIVGARKITINGVPKYDVGDDSSPTSVLASIPGLTIYLGNETQLPNTLIEAALGAGNVQAYRGLVYIVFQDLNLSEFGNSFPRAIDVEIVENGSSALTPQTLYTLTGGEKFPSTTPNGAYNDTDQYNDARTRVTSGGVYTWAVLDNAGGHNRLALIDNYTGQFVFTKDLTAASMFGAPFYIVALGYNDRVWVATYADGLVFHCAFFCVELSGEEHWMLGPQASFDSRLWRRGYEVAPPASDVDDTQQDNPVLYLPHTPSGGNTPIHRFTGINLNADGVQMVDGTVASGAFLRNEFAMGADRVDGRLYVQSFDAAANERVGYIDLDLVAYTFIGATYTSAGTEPWSYVGNDGYLYVRSANTVEANVIEKRTTDGALVDSVALSGWSSTNFDYVHFAQSADGAYLYVEMTSAGETVWKIATGTMTEEWRISLSAGDAIRPSDAFEGVAILDTRITGGGANNVVRVIEPANRITPTARTLDAVVSALMLRSPLTAADIDVTDLAAVQVPGGAVLQPAPIGEALAPFASAFFIDAVESDHKIKFRRRGQAAAVTIPEAKLGARAIAPWRAERSDRPDPLRAARIDELTLPRVVHATYWNPATDYEVGKQSSKRIVTESQQQLTINLPLVLTDAQASQIAETTMDELRIAREGGYEFETTLEYSEYEPTDAVDVIGSGVARTLRLIDRHEGADGVIRWKGVKQLAAAYTQIAPGVASSGVAGAVELIGPTLAEFMDTHLLRDVDNDAGFYFAAKGHVSGWDGTQLYQSKDDGVTYVVAANGTLIPASAFGVTMTKLGDFSNLEGNEIFDEANTVRVTAPGLTLSSYTRAQFFNGTAVPYLIGDEIIYALTATLVSAGTYDLTSLLRGRKGTEPYMTGHSASERFVVLNDNIRSIYQTFAEADIELDYKAVSVGSTLAATANKKFVNTARRKKPLAPWHLKAGRLNAANDIILECRRRTRLENPWRDGADAPLGETTEQYRWDIYNGATIVFSPTSTTTSYTLTAADQTTYFGGAQSSIKFAVSQISTEYGAGYTAGPTTFTVA